MRALRELQQAFGASLLFEGESAVCDEIIEDGFTAAERLCIYRNTFRSTLTEALRMTYPAVARLIGRDCFDMVADQFIRAHPPGSGYLNDYGSGFADFLAALESMSRLPYLPDVARFEWALNVAANAPDAAVLNASALTEVDPQHHALLCFEPHPSVSFLVLAHPADEIADAVLSGDDAAMAEVDVSSGPVLLIIHRGPGGIEAQRLEPNAYHFVSQLCAGRPLGDLLEATLAGTPALLAEQLAKGRLAAFRIGTAGKDERR